jgi:hypothetical protein
VYFPDVGRTLAAVLVRAIIHTARSIVVTYRCLYWTHKKRGAPSSQKYIFESLIVVCSNKGLNLLGTFALPFLQTTAQLQINDAYKRDLLAQIQARHESQRAERQAYLEEGRKVRQEQAREKLRLEQVRGIRGRKEVHNVIATASDEAIPCVTVVS